MAAPNKTAQRKATRRKRRLGRAALWWGFLATILAGGVLGWLGVAPIQAFYFAIGAASFLLARRVSKWSWARLHRATRRSMTPVERKEWRRSLRKATRLVG